jgi:hypothetical protein
MKTMRKGKEILRVSEKQQDDFLERGYEYCPKKVWKDEVRVIKKKKEEIKENLNEKTTKRGKKSTTTN